MHDRNGTLVKDGDIVLIEALVVSTYATEEYCNATLQIGYDDEHGPYNIRTNVTVNTKQVLLLDKSISE